MDGVARCTKYAFGPNRLHLCGPDANKEILSYMAERFSDGGLTALLKQFKTMSPYLQRIAEANNLADPFDDKVVEAYWIGNDLLNGVSKKQFYAHLTDGLKINKLLKIKEFRQVEEKLGLGAKMHHSFHVFNIWKRTGNDPSYHTLESMDKCRISWGDVTSIDGPSIIVRTRPLLFDDRGMLMLGSDTENRKITRKLHDDYMIDLKIGDIITMHWDMPCEIITAGQKDQLEKYTLLSVRLANQSR